VAVDRSSRLSVTKPGFLPATIAAPRPDGDVEVRMLKAGAISGRITDTLGDAVIGMTVTAEIPAASESERKVMASCDTDDLGEYRLAGLPAGRFFVSVDSRAAVIGSNGTLVDEASIASLRNGRRVTRGDEPPNANARLLSGRSDRGRRRTAGRAWRSRWGETSRFVGSVRTGTDGAFSVGHLPPGYYYAAAVTQVAPGDWRNPDLIESLVPSATPVTILEGDTVRTTLSAVTR
jgi:hypothetical protein